MARLREPLTALAVISLPLSTGVHEVALALLLAVSLRGLRTSGTGKLPWVPAAVGVAVACVLAAWASGDVREGLGQAWLLAPLVAVGAVSGRPGVHGLVRWGLAAAAAVAAIAVAQAMTGREAVGLYSHHLSLAYALLPPFAVALVERRFALAALLAAGVLAAGSDAAPVALLAAAAAAWTGRTWLSLAGGAAVTLGALVSFAGADELRQRAVLWTGGLLVPPGSAGVGGYAAASAGTYDQLSPGFWFPNHAHDNFVQLGATLGAGGVAATCLLVALAFRHGHRGAAAGLVGVLVGGLTQNTLGDLEVARAAWVWLAILGTSGLAGGQPPACSSSSPPPLPEPSTRP